VHLFFSFFTKIRGTDFTGIIKQATQHKADNNFSDGHTINFVTNLLLYESILSIDYSLKEDVLINITAIQT